MHVVAVWGGPAHAGAEVGRVVVEDLGGAQLTDRRRVLRPRRGDHAGPGPGGQGDGGAAHVPRAAPDVHGLPARSRPCRNSASQAEAAGWAAATRCSASMPAGAG